MVHHNGDGVPNLMQELGRLQRHHTTAGDYAKSLALLRALKAGTVTLDDVHVTEDGWQLVQVTEAPPEVAAPAVEVTP